MPKPAVNASNDEMAASLDSDAFAEIDRGVAALLSPDGRHHVDRRAGLVHVTDHRERLDQVALYLETVQVRAVPVAGAVHMLQGAGGNIGLVVGDDAVFVVDDQYAPLTPKVLVAVSCRPMTPTMSPARLDRTTRSASTE